MEVLKQIKNALQYRKPFSLVRVGDGENIILAQGKFMSEEEVMNSYWVQQSESGKGKGVTLPSLRLRDRLLRHISKANIVGICRNSGDRVRAPAIYKRELTNKIFEFYNLTPKQCCYVFINREMVSHRMFWEIMNQYRVLLISKWARDYADFIRKKYPKLRPNIVECINFTHYDQIPKLLKQVGKYHFDLALISAGVNALIIAPKIAEMYGKVAIDFGKTMMFTVQSCKLVSPWKA